jgi:hypothetical protein
MRTYLRHKLKAKKDWENGSSGRLLSYQVQDFSFNPQYWKKGGKALNFL